MKIEDNVYILTSEIKGETIYLTDDKSGYDYSFDIHDALKAANKRAALDIKDDYEDDLNAKSDLKIVPLKITYEWQENKNVDGEIMFKNIKKCLDEFENTTKKVDNGEAITREEEAAVWYFDLRLAEAMLRDGNFAERVAAIILTEQGIPERLEFKFNNEVAFND